ncbi:MAG: amino acid adenylation domain-containing protein [Desulfovibrio sp.]|uniref:amino acid adenylation domain-containing protein n=1 Tax=Desulfovibrio sp. TaxID=885 RepID=UPI0039E58EC5
MSAVPTYTDYDHLAFMLELRRQGVTLHAESGELVCRGNASVLTDHVVEQLRCHKQAILAQLASEQTSEGMDLPRLVPRPEEKYLPFPLNENQQAYWMGRDASVAFGSIGIHAYFELEIRKFDAQRFEYCWNTLLQRHDMLHAVVLTDGTQRILRDFSNFSLKINNLTHMNAVDAEQVLFAERATLSHSCYPLEAWPQTEFRAFALKDGATVLMGSLDCWCLDGHSLQVLMRELTLLYAGETLPPVADFSFRDYVLALADFKNSPTYARSLAYWREKVRTLPPAPAIPLRSNRGYGAAVEPISTMPVHTAPCFKRHEVRLEPQTFAQLTEKLRQNDLTLSTLLLGCYAETLGHWSYESRFTINVPRVNRLPVHPDIERCVGEFASFSLTIVDNTQADRPFAARCRELQRQIWQDLEHEHVSGVTVLREWRQATGVGPETGMPFVFTSEPESNARSHASSWVGSLGSLGTVRQTLTQTPQVWVDAQYGMIDGALHLSWDVLENMFPENLPETMFDTFVQLVQSIAADTAAWQSPLPLYQILTPRCSYSTEYGPKVDIGGDDALIRLEKQAQKMGRQWALVDHQGQMLWQDVYEAVTRLAARLKKAGLPRHARVGMALHKGRWQVIAPFAVRAAGGVTVPLDPEAPSERLRGILHDCGASLVLTDGSATARAAASGIPVMDPRMDQDGDNVLLPPSTAMSAFENDIFSVIYTSGSTGVPKGVLVPYKGILNCISQFSSFCPLGQETPSLALSPFHHDMAVPDYAGNVLLGMPTVFPEHSRRKDPAHWLELMREHRVRFWNSVPSMLTMLLDFCATDPAPGLENLRLVSLGGDWIPLSTARALLQRAPRTRLVSVGGPTEISVANISYQVRDIAPQWDSIPYGRPFQNAGYHVLNQLGQVCPRGVAGELCCTGPYMSAGYLNDPKRNGAAFGLLPGTGERLYKTGDMGRMHEDGVIEFLGRRDSQVKIHGFRMELSEIEAQVQRHPDVRQAVIFLSKGSKKLCAYVAPHPGSDLSVEDVRAFLKKRLPSYMIPSFIGQCETFPLSANAKVDREAVKQWPTRAQRTDFIPDTPTEKAVAQAWNAVLGAPPENADANFFESGGDSIAAIRLLNLLRGQDFNGLGVMDIFRHPTPTALCSHMNDLRGNHENNIPPVLPSRRRSQPSAPDGGKVFPASHAQKRLWIEETLHPETARYILAFRVKISGHVTAGVIENALQRVADRHEALRTTLHCRHDEVHGETADTQVWQRVHPRLAVPFAHVDAHGRAAEAQQTLSDKAYREISQQTFDLAVGPLLRACLVERDAPETGADLYLAFHHAAFDGWSMRLFMNSLHEALDDKGVLTICPSIDYADMADWEQSQSMTRLVAERLKGMKKELADVTRPELPSFASISQYVKSTTQHGKAPAEAYITYPLPDDLAVDLRQRAVASGVTPFILCFAAFSLLISRYSASNNLLLGTYAAQRFTPELENVVGMMVTPLPLAIRLDRASTFRELLTVCRESLIRAGENSIVPFDSLVREVEAHRQPGRHPLFDIAFSQDNTEETAFSVNGMAVRLEPGGRHESAMSLDISMRDGQGALVFEVTADASVWPLAALTVMLDRLRWILRQVTDAPGLALEEISLIPPEEQAPLAQWRQGETPGLWPSLWQRFEDIAASHADAPCLTYGCGQMLNFGQLHKLSTAVAGWIDAVCPQRKPVALCLERGPLWVAAILAAWRAGRAVTPVNPGMPRERLRDILAQSRVAAVLMDTRWHEWFEFDSQNTPICLDVAEFEKNSAIRSANTSPVMQSDADTPMLTLFTSGSSGRPKGVSIGQGALINRLQWGGEAIPFEPGEQCCAKTDTGFVDAVTELFTPLLHAVPVHIVPDADIRRMDAVLHALEQHGVTRLVAVPSALHALTGLASHTRVPLPALRHIISSGEPLSGHLVSELHKAFPNAVIHNFYGSTEVCGEAVWRTVSPHDAEGMAVPLGKPISGATVMILDADGQELPWGLHGEIAVQGKVLAQGYLNPQTGSLEQSGGFTPQSISAKNASRTFRTGDRGVWTADGLLLGLGRLDRQIKIRGQRIAPQEVEQALRSLPEVHDVVVVMVGADETAALAACVIPESNLSFDAATVQCKLGACLPPAFIPTIFLTCATFPLTSSGKVDVTALRKDLEQQAKISQAESACAPVCEDAHGIGAVLADLWWILLHRKPKSNSNFFQEGGHSLLAIKLAVLLGQRLDAVVDVRVIFEQPVFEHLVNRLAGVILPAEANAEWEEL